VPIQVAHLAGGGGPSDTAAHEALEVLVAAVVSGDARTRRLWFDVTGIGTIPKLTIEEATFFATKIRQIGVRRILYGSDAASAGNTPRESWAAFRRLPLSDEEFRIIATNVAPYLR